jgi:hypothetical protein
MKYLPIVRYSALVDDFFMLMFFQRTYSLNNFEKAVGIVDDGTGRDCLVWAMR